jgi:Tol biopolymer transport system component
VELQDLRSGKVERLLDAWASLPQWSPDGKYISCVVWRSVLRHHELTIVDVATKTLMIDPNVRASGTDAKWSPDSRNIAASGVIYASPRSLLYTVSIPGGSVTILDSLDVLAAHEFSWSPDAKWVVFSHPTELDEMGEDPVAASLWIAEVATGRTWPLLEAAEWIHTDPLWITNKSIQVTRMRRENDALGTRQTVVVDLTNSKEN